MERLLQLCRQKRVHGTHGCPAEASGNRRGGWRGWPSLVWSCLGPARWAGARDTAPPTLPGTLQSLRPLFQLHICLEGEELGQQL